MKLRVGLVGLGDAWESRHRPALRALSDRFEVRAVCAEVALRAQHAADEFGAATVDGFRALVAREDIDAVLMLSPQWYGPLPILAACDAGKAVYCAAALDLEISQARQVKSRVENAGIAFMAEFPRRNAAATLRLKELIATRLGQPRLLFCHQRHAVPRLAGGSRVKCMSAIVNRDLLELVDWCRYVIGRDPDHVVGVRYQTDEHAGDRQYRMMTLQFPPFQADGDGPMAQISCGHYLPEQWKEAITFRPPAGLQVCCDHGIAFLDLPTTLVWFDEAGRHMESLDSERPVGEELLSHFHRAVTSLVRKTHDLEDAYRALLIVLRAEQSAQEGRRLELDFG